jgi:hypothetical protein
VLHLFGHISCCFEEILAFGDGKEVTDFPECLRYGIKGSGGAFAQQGFEL